MSLAIAIGKGLITAASLLIAIWMVYRAGYESGHAQGQLDARCGTDTDEHEGGLLP